MFGFGRSATAAAPPRAEVVTPGIARPLACTSPTHNSTLPMRVLNIDSVRSSGAIHIAGCASVERATWLTVVFALPSWDQMTWEYHAPNGGDGAEVDDQDQGRGEYFIRRPVRHNMNFIKSVDVSFTLNQQACGTVKWTAAAAYANCTLDRPAEAGMKFLITASAGANDGTQFRCASTVLLAMEVASWLVPNSGTRNLVWTGAPAFTPRCKRMSWTKVATWAEQWRKANFSDLVVHVREHSLCRGLRNHGIQCVSRPAFPSESPNAFYTPRGRIERRDYSEQSWNNMVGLAQARAAGYSTVAFIDIDELPPVQGDIASFLAAIAQLRASDEAYASVFFRPTLCSRCPANSKELVDLSRSKACNSSALWSGERLKISVAKVIGIPSRMRSIEVHSAEPAPPLPRKYVGCLQHPAPPFEGGSCDGTPVAPPKAKAWFEG